MNRFNDRAVEEINITPEALLAGQAELQSDMLNDVMDNAAQMRQFIDFVANYLQPPGLYDNSRLKRPKDLKKKEAIKLLETFQNMAIEVLEKIDNPKRDKVFIEFNGMG